MTSLNLKDDIERLSDEQLVSEYRKKLAQHALYENKQMSEAMELRNLIEEMLERGLTSSELNTLHN